ncbi:GFA family protein [Croceicoccus sp. F390]|uniref:GFA family protein n=1 Tax=Croceicoccus esteveae TaxID=3075597 RepID=A0ABU2ZHB3_9SPHN|nr:GFA family protein [Croceicoccus sp. F390]MDT0575994.1 GFA family protein [Croceicoccus sp. F390]
MTGERREGGCLCGAVRYSLPWPLAMAVSCSCRNCQKQSGAPLSLVGVTMRDGLEIGGTLATYVDTAQSGNAVYRQFCPACGSPVLTDTDAARAQGVIFIKGGTLDDATELRPTVHCWTQSAPAWLSFAKGDTIMQRQEGL